MRPVLLQLSALPPAVEAELDKRFAATRWADVSDKEAWIRMHGPEIAAVVTSGHAGLPTPMLLAMPELKIIAINGVGYDRIDFEITRARGVQVTNTPGVLTDDVADLTIGLILSVARGLPGADAFVRLGAWPERALSLGRRMSGRRYGILGLGRIGQAIARRLEGFGGEIGYASRSPKPVGHARFETPVELAAWADIFIVACSAVDGEPPVVDKAVIDAIGPQGMLVNVARGSLVDEAAMIDALRNGRLGAAALDVFESEPFVPEALRSLPNVVLAPHIGSATVETRQAMAELMLANLDAWLAGEPLPTPVA